MWPSILGPGWIWGVLVALAFLCFVLAVLGFLLIVINRPRRDAVEPGDLLWHRLEEGDITPAEFERLKRVTTPHLSARGVGK